MCCRGLQVLLCSAVPNTYLQMRPPPAPLHSSRCWFQHIEMNATTGSDPNGIRVRPASGLRAADGLMGGAYSLWAPLLQTLGQLGFDENSVYMAAYDWRLGVRALEARDAAFTRLKLSMEAVYAAAQTTGMGEQPKLVLAAHSLGGLVVHAFLQWVHSPLAADIGDPAPCIFRDGAWQPRSSSSLNCSDVAIRSGWWAEKYIHTLVHVASPTLGVPKTLAAVYSGEAKDSATMAPLVAAVKERFMPRSAIRRVARSFGSMVSMLPVGGDAVWGDLSGLMPVQGVVRSVKPVAEAAASPCCSNMTRFTHTAAVQVTGRLPRTGQVLACGCRIGLDAGALSTSACLMKATGYKGMARAVANLTCADLCSTASTSVASRPAKRWVTGLALKYFVAVPGAAAPDQAHATAPLAAAMVAYHSNWMQPKMWTHIRQANASATLMTGAAPPSESPDDTDADESNEWILTIQQEAARTVSAAARTALSTIQRARAGATEVLPNSVTRALGLDVLDPTPPATRAHEIHRTDSARAISGMTKQDEEAEPAGMSLEEVTRAVDSKGDVDVVARNRAVWPQYLPQACDIRVSTSKRQPFIPPDLDQWAWNATAHALRGPNMTLYSMDGVRRLIALQAPARADTFAAWANQTALWPPSPAELDSILAQAPRVEAGHKLRQAPHWHGMAAAKLPRAVYGAHAGGLPPPLWTNMLAAPLPHAPSMRVVCVYGTGMPAERAYAYHGVASTPTEAWERLWLNHGDSTFNASWAAVNGDAEAVRGALQNASVHAAARLANAVELSGGQYVPVTIAREVHSSKHDIEYGVLSSDGDATVPLMSLGYMCRRGWKDPARNPANILTSTLELAATSGAHAFSQHTADAGVWGELLELTAATVSTITQEGAVTAAMNALRAGSAASGDHVDLLLNKDFLRMMLRLVTDYHGNDPEPDHVVSNIDAIADRLSQRIELARKAAGSPGAMPPAQ